LKYAKLDLPLLVILYCAQAIVSTEKSPLSNALINYLLNQLPPPYK
jgi:hypothetical protein